MTTEAEEFFGPATDGKRVEDLFTVRRDGVSDDRIALGAALLKDGPSTDGLEATERIRRINRAAGEAVSRTAVADTSATKAGDVSLAGAFRVYSPVSWSEFGCRAPGPLAGACPSGASTTGTSRHYATSPHHQH